MTRLPSIKIRQIGWWTKRRIDNGLRRLARDYFKDREADLPQYYYNYRHIMPVADRRRARRERLYPPFAAVLRVYESLYDAWTELGYDVKFRPIEFWTRAQVISGLKDFHRDFQCCPVSTDTYSQKQQFTGKIINGRASNRGADQKYPSFYAVLKHFSSMRAAWHAAGFDVDSTREPWTEIEDWFIRETIGILPRAEVAAYIKRTVPAVKRRLYDLGRISSKDRWGISMNRATELLNISRFAIGKYVAGGIIPIYRGNKNCYLNPADLTKVAEVDWSDESRINPELRELIKRALVQRAAKILTYRDRWREHEIYVFERKSRFRGAATCRTCRATEPPATPALPKSSTAPTAWQTGDSIILSRRVRQVAAGRQGIIKGIHYAPEYRLKSGAAKGGYWFASVEFSKVFRLAPTGSNLIRYNLPLDALLPIHPATREIIAGRRTI